MAAAADSDGPARWQFAPEANVRATFSTCDGNQSSRTTLYVDGDQVTTQSGVDLACGNDLRAHRLLTNVSHTTATVAKFARTSDRGTIRLTLRCSNVVAVACNAAAQAPVDADGGASFLFTAPDDVRFSVDTCTVTQNETGVTETSQDGTVRLVNGRQEGEGRVEYFINGTWKTICGHNFGLEEARVVCGQLACPNNQGSPVRHGQCPAHFGCGSGESALGFLNCFGDEDSLTDCRRVNTDTACSGGHCHDASACCLGTCTPNVRQCPDIGGCRTLTIEAASTTM